MWCFTHLLCTSISVTWPARLHPHHPGARSERTTRPMAMLSAPCDARSTREGLGRPRPRARPSSTHGRVAPGTAGRSNSRVIERPPPGSPANEKQREERPVRIAQQQPELDGPAVAALPVAHDGRDPAPSAEHHERRRSDLRHSTDPRVVQPDASASPPAPPSAPATSRAWRVRPAALAPAAGLAAIALIRFDLTPHGVLAAGVLAALVVLASIDLQARLLPNIIVLPATAAVLAWQGAFFPRRTREWILAALGAGFLVLLPALIRPGPMGMGDVKLAVLLGAVLGRDVISALTVGSVALLPVALWLLVRGRGVRNTTVPLGPFLAFGAAVVLLG